MKDNATKQVIEHGIDLIDEYDGIPADELHHRLYNEDYFIIGYNEAEKFLNEYGTFNAIELIKQYEQDNFGEVNTDFSDSEKVANMFAYIVGEEALNNCETYQGVTDYMLDKKTLQKIKSELEAQL